MSKVSVTRLVLLCLLLMAVLSSTAGGAPVQIWMKVPNGSYMLTCNQCSLSNGVTYSCKCKNDRGSYVSTSIALNKCTQASDGFYYLTNQNGSLTCSTSSSS